MPPPPRIRPRTHSENRNLDRNTKRSFVTTYRVTQIAHLTGIPARDALPNFVPDS
jgi:hypothetical protein